MSHNVTALVPYITEHTTALFTAGAGQSLIIKGFGLGLNTRVEIPAALGVETARTFTKTGATEGVLTITMTVAAIPASPVIRSIGISMGGVPAQGPVVTAGAISIYHGWTPAVLTSGDKDYWWNPDDLSLTDGDAVASFTDSANGLTLTESNASKQPTFKDSTYVWSGSKTAAAIASGGGDVMDDVVIPLELTSGVLEITFAFAVKIPALVPGWLVNIHVGGIQAAHRFSIGFQQHLITLISPGNSVTYAPGGIIFAAGQIVVIVITGSGGTVTLEPIPGTMASALTDTYTPTTAPTSESQMFGGLASEDVLYGETILLSRAITASDITQLKAYWANKYGS